MTNQPIRYDSPEFFGDLNHLVQPIVGMMKLHLSDDMPIDISYMEQTLSLVLALADLAFAPNKVKNLDVIRDGRAVFGCGFFSNESEEIRKAIQKRFNERRSND